MTAYVVNHLKKKRILEKRKQELGHAIKNNYPANKIERAAENLRFAQLNVFKCNYAKRTVLPIHKYIPNEEAQQWGKYSASEIVEKYLRENPIEVEIIERQEITMPPPPMNTPLIEKYKEEQPINIFRIKDD